MPTSSRSCAQHQKASCGVPTACQFGAGGAGVRPSTSGPAPAPCPLPRAALQQIPPPPRQRFWKFTSEADQKGERRPRRRGRGQPPNAGASRLWRHTRPALRLTPALCATSPGQTEPSARRSRSGLPQPGPRTAPAWGPPRPGDGTGRDGRTPQGSDEGGCGGAPGAPARQEHGGTSRSRSRPQFRFRFRSSSPAAAGGSAGDVRRDVSGGWLRWPTWALTSRRRTGGPAAGEERRGGGGPGGCFRVNGRER